MRPFARAAGVLVLLAACTSAATPPEDSGSPQQPSGPTRSTVPSPTGPALEFVLPPPTPGAESADAVRTRLCVRPPAPETSPAPATTPPPAVSEVEDEVEQVRGLNYVHPVAIDPATHEELVQGLTASFDHSFPTDMLARRSKAWSTIGVITPGTSLRDAYKSFLSSQVIGYYDPSNGQLVFIGSDQPSPYERFTLAHELTHADDDQHFRLDRLNDLENACDDERLLAATGAVEGSAVYFSQEVVQEFFSAGDQARLAFSGGGGSPVGVPPFVQHIEEWPYIDGPRFITDVRAVSGLDEVNAALREFPASTEQVMHPDRFPDDRPAKVSVPDLGPTLGSGWRDLDVMDTGEEWIRELLALRLDTSLAADAAEGWGGAQYRAWTDGSHVAVVLDTTWDTAEDASQFLGSMRAWIADRDDAAVGRVRGGDTGVVALFGSDASTLRLLERALR